MNVNSLITNTVHSAFRSKLKYELTNYRLCFRKLSCTQLRQSTAQISNENEPELEKNLVKFKNRLRDGPNLKDFFKNEHLKDQENLPEEEIVPYLQDINRYGAKRKVYFDVYGCQMNVNDTEIIWAILKDNKFERESFGKDCSVDVVAGPDSYRDLPRLLALTENNQKTVNVLLSLDETYADITPVRLNEDSISAFISIMRGCDNMCTYCIVPFTRGRERSRPVSSILKEVEHLSKNGVKEVTLLGQNVNSYRDLSEDGRIDNVTSMARGLKTVYKIKKGGLRFADLLQRVADINPEMRIRFTSPHPKDFPDEVIQSLHMPAQSGNSAVLERMRRGYTREAYIELIQHIRRCIPDVVLSSDFICGFCGETEEEFEDTITLMNEVQYNIAFLFAYSMREKTTAHRRFQDDVPPEVKQKRVARMIEVFSQTALKLNRAQIGRNHLVLIECHSRKSKNFFQGRNDQNVRVILPATELVPFKDGGGARVLKPGDYVAAYINDANSQLLKAIPLYLTGLQEFYSVDYVQPRAAQI
ncbi:hypothetical protein NQ314_002725 [Rhamnusium bicolor]|uniref:CDK5RAP1-like protein n=1 Tax=Rhamnusium bicolor TaxID=1586634 RepID=A0AAV8ZRI5_9CUCU|nr:hypothetical protein NQ314_002725 [Rhamnusium bicolor]